MTKAHHKPVSCPEMFACKFFNSFLVRNLLRQYIHPQSLSSINNLLHLGTNIPIESSITCLRHWLNGPPVEFDWVALLTLTFIGYKFPPSLHLLLDGFARIELSLFSLDLIPCAKCSCHFFTSFNQFIYPPQSQSPNEIMGCLPNVNV